MSDASECKVGKKRPRDVQGASFNLHAHAVRQEMVHLTKAVSIAIFINVNLLSCHELQPALIHLWTVMRKNALI